MNDDARCCGTGMCLINDEGRCWCGQQWDGEKMCRPNASGSQPANPSPVGMDGVVQPQKSNG